MAETVGTPIRRARDELELQAWLARAELRRPSAGGGPEREELSALAALRDELRVQLALGRAELRDEWRRLEDRWWEVKGVAESAGAEASETLHDLLRQIRDGYARLRAV
jgi:hypothetical protein